MQDILADQIMEQRLLPVVLFVLVIFLVTGVVIKETGHDFFDLQKLWVGFHEWLHWKIMPGW